MEFWRPLSIRTYNVKELIQKFNYLDIELDPNYDDSYITAVLGYVAFKMRDAARTLSPYLYGILSASHRAAIETLVNGAKGGIVYIDTDVVHPFLGGNPHIYGYRIHTSGRPWFEWAILSFAPSILNEAGAKLTEAVAETFKDGMQIPDFQPGSFLPPKHWTQQLPSMKFPPGYFEKTKDWWKNIEAIPTWYDWMGPPEDPFPGYEYTYTDDMLVNMGNVDYSTEELFGSAGDMFP